MEEWFDIFTKHSRNASNSIFNEYIITPRHPISHIDFNPIFVYVVNSDSRFWKMPNSIRIHSETKVTLQAGSPISPTEKLSLQDLACHSLFQQIETRIINVPIYDHGRLYHTVFTLFKLILRKLCYKVMGFSEMSTRIKMRM